MKNRTVLISGAGIAGPTLAYWLLRHGYAPTIIEQSPALRTGGYMIDFWGLGYDVAERMGLLPVLLTDGYRLEEVRLVDSSGIRRAGFDIDVFRAATRNRYVSLLRGDLAQRIYETVAQRVEIIFGDTVVALKEAPDGVDVSFNRGSPRRFDLIAGADGLHSRVRGVAFGEESSYERYLGYYVAAFTA